MARGTEREAEEIAEGVRAEMGLSNLERLDPRSLLSYLEIPFVPLSQLGHDSRDEGVLAAVNFLRTEATSSLSAMTVFRGTKRLVVYADHHDAGRTNSDLCHEAGHALLMHEPAPVFGMHGCRAWDRSLEEEAQYLAGALLIPGKAARYAAKAGWSHQYMESRFCCSLDMVRWRDNVSGGRNLRRSR